MDSDWLLIAQMRHGSDDAWDQFVRKYYGDILKYCFFHCQEKETAEDLTQEVFLKFFSALAGYRHQGKAKNYLYTIARNCCRNQAASRPALPLEAAADASIDFSSDLDDRLAIMSAIRRLPEEFQEILLLHYFQGLKLTEASVVLNIGLPLVKYRLKRAKELLRKELDHGFESSSSNSKE